MEKFRRYFEAFSAATEWSEVQPAFNDVFHPERAEEVCCEDQEALLTNKKCLEYSRHSDY